MSKCLPKNKEFMDYVYSRIRRSWADNCLKEIKICYDASVYNKRDYVLDATILGHVHWTSESTRDLKDIMREAGAYNIIGCVRHAMARDYLDLAFDINEKKFNKILEAKKTG